MKSQRIAGFTHVELIAVIVVVAILALVIHPQIRNSVELAVSTSMKGKGRGIWTSVLSATAERELVGLGSVWPKDLGFDASHTSTEYFHMLMSDNPSTITNMPSGPIAEDLRPAALGGGGVPYADSLADFSSTNNAWHVVCGGVQTPGSRMIYEAAFLISRNVTIGRQVNALSPMKFDKQSPLRIRRCVYLTFGGACIDQKEQYMYTAAGVPVIFADMGTNTTYDVMYP